MANYYVKDGKVSTGIELRHDSMYISSGGTANDTIVDFYGRMYISSGGTANDTTINGDGKVYISSGGTANNTTVKADGWMYISSGGMANDTNVTRGGISISSGGTANDTDVTDGTVYIFSGGTANDTTINAKGKVYISSGGTATNIIWTPCVGHVTAEDGTHVTYTSQYSGVYFGSDNQLLSHTDMMSGKVLSGASMYIMAGGTANYITTAWGNIQVNSGGMANYIQVAGSNIVGTPVSGVIAIYLGGTVNYTSVAYDGKMQIYSGGIANSTSLGYDGQIYIHSGGTANFTSVNSKGDMYISSGGIANHTYINYAGAMYISSGGVHRGTLTIEYGGAVVAAQGASIDFFLSDRKSSDIYLINNLSRISAEYDSFTITVADNQSEGVYRLAQGASNFAGTLSIGNGTTAYGSIDVNEDDFIYNDVIYSLDQVDGNLTLSITKSETPLLNLSFSGIPEIWTNNDAVIAITADKECTIQYQINDGEWQTYSDAITVSENCTINVKAVDVTGNCVKTASFSIDKIDDIADKGNAEYIFIKSSFNEKITGQKQNNIPLIFGYNAFNSIKNLDTTGKLIIIADSKVNGNVYADKGIVTAFAVLPTIKESITSYSYKSTAAAKNTLNITQDTGSTLFTRFATVNITSAAVCQITGGKASRSEAINSSLSKNGTVNDTEKYTYSSNVSGKFTAAAKASVTSALNYSSVKVTDAVITTLRGGNETVNISEKYVAAPQKNQKVLSTSSSFAAAGSVTLQTGATVRNIINYNSVNAVNATIGEIVNFTAKDSQKDNFTFDIKKNSVSRTLSLSHTENTAGSLNAVDSVLGDVTGFTTVSLKNTSASTFRRVDAAGKCYGSISEKLTVKTTKDGFVTGSYRKTESFTRGGKLTATGSTVSDIENFSTVIMDNSTATHISNFLESKIVTEGSFIRENSAAYGIPEDYAPVLEGVELVSKTTTSLNGSVTLKNGSFAESITNFNSVSMTASRAETIANVEKVTISKGNCQLGSFTGTAGNDTFTIAKGAVLELANGMDFGTGGKDKLVISGTLILQSTAGITNTIISGKGEIAAESAVYSELELDFANFLDLGATAKNFKGSLFENSDNTLKKAILWNDTTQEYSGWLGNWQGNASGSDTVDFIKFKASAGTEISVIGVDNWVLMDKKGNDIGQTISAPGEYILQLTNNGSDSVAYSVTLAS